MRAYAVLPGAVAALAAALFGARPASAAEPMRATPVGGFAGQTDPLFERKHTVAELEAGILALPYAPISEGQRGGATPFGTIGRGDATIQLGTHILYRAARAWAIGAGAFFAPRPTSDNLPVGVNNLQRSHARSYLDLGAELRFIPFHFRAVEIWFGGDVGFVFIADRYTTKTADKVPTILGTKEVTIGSNGFAAGALLGVDWQIGERLLTGISLRYDRWLLPRTPTCSSIGDCSTLLGPNDAVMLSLKIAYRIPL